MRTSALLLALLLPVGVLAAAPEPSWAQAQPPTAQQIAGRVQAFYNQTKTFQADFKQEYTIMMHGKKQGSAGHVIFEKPGKMSWKYDQPNGNRVVSDGKDLKVYDAQNQQMFEQPVNGSQYPAALSFLMGQGDLESSFNLRLLDSKAMSFENGYVLEGTPKAATPAYQKVLLYVDAQTAQVRRVLILDVQGNRNRFDFENPIVNMPVSPKDFSFTPPPGTQIIHP